MPSIDLEVFDHIVFALLVAVLPWNARRRFRALVEATDRGDSSARTRAYRTIVVEKWAFTAIIAVAWSALGRSAASIGLRGGLSTLAIAGYVLTAAMIGALVMLAQATVRSEEGRSKTRDTIASVRALVPHTMSEKRWFNVTSVSAGIGEEIVYRAFLFAYFAAWLPDAPVAIIILLAAHVFGLGHLYQGAAGVVKTGSLGVLLGVVYWMTGAVWAPIILHVAVDLSSGWITQQVTSEDEPESVQL